MSENHQGEVIFCDPIHW